MQTLHSPKFRDIGLISLTVLLVFIFAVMTLQGLMSPQPQQLPITAIAIINGHSIQLEVAQTPEQQAIGLMHRQSLEPGRGMLFPVQPPRVVSLWMKNVNLPLDILMIRQNTIVQIVENAPPCTADPCPIYRSNQAVDTVIELNGGSSLAIGATVKSSVKIQHLP